MSPFSGGLYHAVLSVTIGRKGLCCSRPGKVWCISDLLLSQALTGTTTHIVLFPNDFAWHELLRAGEKRFNLNH